MVLIIGLLFFYTKGPIPDCLNIFITCHTYFKIAITWRLQSHLESYYNYYMQYSVNISFMVQGMVTAYRGRMIYSNSWIWDLRDRI